MDVIFETVDPCIPKRNFSLISQLGNLHQQKLLLFYWMYLGRFEKPIKRQQMRTFSSEGTKVKKKSTDRKVIEMKMERNLFGKLLCVTLEKEIDL